MVRAIVRPLTRALALAQLNRGDDKDIYWAGVLMCNEVLVCEKVVYCG